MRIRLSSIDSKWSKLVRERDGKCRRCGRKPPYALNAHHIMPRSRSNTRYDLKNGLTLCVTCHTFGDDSVHRSPEGSKRWCIKLIGSKEWNRLERLSLQYKARDKARKEFLTKYK